MSLNVCPADTVKASVERVWELLGCPAEYGRFWDFTVERVEPEGGAVVGQTLVGWSWAFGRRWQVEGEIEEVDTQRHQILFSMALPFGWSATTGSPVRRPANKVAFCALAETSSSRLEGGAGCGSGYLS